MEVIALVATLTTLCSILRLPLFETTFAVLLLTPVYLALLPFLLPFQIVNDRFAYFVIFALLLIAIMLLNEKRQRPRTIQTILKESLPNLLFCMAFLIVYRVCLLWPDFIKMGERLRDFAMLSSVYNAPFSFNPEEPWLAGFAFKYYLYWYRFGRLLGVSLNLPIWETYHQLIAFTSALFIVSIYYLMRACLKFSIWSSVFCSLFIALGSNIAGVVAFYKGDKGWWGPSRVIPGAINEFPAWSFLLGDAHPHFLNLALVPFFLVVVLKFAQCRWAYSKAILIWGGAIIISILLIYNSNAWEAPLWVGLISVFGILSLCQSYFVVTPGQSASLTTIEKRPIVAQAIIIVLVFGALISLLYTKRELPPTQATFRLVRAPIERTKVVDMILHWGFPLLIISLSLIFSVQGWFGRTVRGALLVVLLFYEEALALLLALFILNGHRLLQLMLRRERRASTEILFESIGVVALGILIIPEVTFLDDAYGGIYERMNTIFKFYSANWFLLHTFAFYLFWRVFRDYWNTKTRTALFATGQAVVLVSFCGFLITTISERKTKPLTVEPYAQGLSSINRDFPGAAATIQALYDMEPGIVLEAQGDAYSYTTHVATLSAKSAFLGWANHVNLLTQQYSEVGRREQLTKSFYTTMSCEQKLQMLQAEKIKYVVVGPLERERYSSLKDETFNCLRLIAEKERYRLYIAAAKSSVTK